MGLFTPAETLGLTFEQYMEEQMLDEYNWMTWIVIALDIAYGAAAMATGIAPLLIGLAPVTIALIIASLYSLLWYYIVLPFGLAVYAKNPNNFNTADEKQTFVEDASTFLEQVSTSHGQIASFLTAMLLIKGPLGIRTAIENILELSKFKEIANAALSGVIKWMMRILVGYGVLNTILGYFQPLIENGHLRYLLIDLFLSGIGLANKYLMTLMFILNFIAWISFKVGEFWIKLGGDEIG
ncbi:MAG: hypothetical protein D6732_00725 [Methanobacteriota archaeon]|nr:MAG: hypothetical protein D6732_00725 [Euryarchaeota archaeon]